MSDRINLQKQNCSGCRACANVCPINAISFENDAFGFSYPAIDYEKCLTCGKCVSVCEHAMQNRGVLPQKAFAAAAKNADILRSSSSGGVFSVLAEHILSLGGAVCGCVYDASLSPIHICSEKYQDFLLMRKSKYAQSNVGLVYRDIKERLSHGQIVLFSGTPCQVAGIRAFLGKEYENLLTIDLVCHGVPSSLLFKRFLEYLERKHKTKITNFDFRSKKHGWQRFTMEFTNAEGKKKNIGKVDEFYLPAFTMGNTLRESCYVCPFADPRRMGDFTIADLWGYEKIDRLAVSTAKGLSLCTLNTDKAIKLLPILQEGMILQEIDYSLAVKGNTCLRTPTPRGKLREKYMHALKTNSLNEMATRYRERNKKARATAKAKLLIPISLFAYLKKMQARKPKH